MAANKEAIGIVLDIGPSMNQAPPGVATALETAIDAITMILQRKMFAESKDEIALILVGTPDTDNPLADGSSYENISIVRPLGTADFDLLQYVQNDLQPSNISGDFIDGMVVAMDHVVTAIQGKRGFAAKRLIVISDLGGEFGDDQLDTIVAALKNSETELNVIGPDLEDDDDEDGGGDGPSAMNGLMKEKTPQQRAGEELMKHIIDEVNGASYSFQEALPALSFFQSRQVRPTAWKCQMEIGESFSIPICGYVKVKDFKLKQSWKRIYAKDADMEVGTLRTFHLNDEEETEIEKEDIAEGHRYGNTLVPMTDEDKQNMKFKAEKCLKLLGFTKSENVKRHHYLGDGVLSIVADKTDEAAAVALSALINAMYETNTAAIARRVYSGASAPKIGALIPHIKADYECLYWVELPFMEDVRSYTFGTLPLKDDATTNTKYTPTAQQLSAMDALIDGMDLSQADDDDGEKSETMKPKLTFNPYFQRVYQCLQHRALNPDDALPDLAPLIASCLNPPQEISTQCEQICEKVKNKFKFEVVVKKKEDQTGENMFKENNAEDGEVAAKRPRLDDNLDGGMKDITKAKVTEVGTVTPIEDFQSLINRKDEDLMEEACKQMRKRIQQIVMDSFGTQFYEKAMDCLKVLRKECIEKAEPKLFNVFITEFRDTLIGKGRKDFWDQIVTDKQGLISKVESEYSNVSTEEAQKFITEEEEVKDDTPENDESAEDLLDML